MTFGATFPYLALPHVDNVNLGTERSPRAPEFIPVNPQRVLETRTDQAGGQIGYTGAKPAAGSVDPGQGHRPRPGSLVPTTRPTVFLNVTAVNSAADGFVTVYPCGTTAAAGVELQPDRRRRHAQPGGRDRSARTATCASSRARRPT